MAYFKIHKNEKNKLYARVQVSYTDKGSGKRKILNRRIYNEDDLTPARFRKHIEKLSIELESNFQKECEKNSTFTSQILSFPELANEWLGTIRATLSISYYNRAKDVIGKFNDFLMRYGLYKKPINELTVRQIQLFINEKMEGRPVNKQYYKLKCELPKRIWKLQMPINTEITEKQAIDICERHDLCFTKYFEKCEKHLKYSLVTIKGFRRLLRTIFNEAVRYEWIIKNPVCLTKVTSKGNNGELISITEKEVFTLSEIPIFLKSLEELGDAYIYKTLPIKIMLLTGIRNGELHGLKWSDIDFTKKIIHIKRSRLYSPGFGVYEKEPKTETSIRDVPIPDSLIEDFERFKQWFRLMDENFDKKLDQYYIVSDLYREPMNPDALGSWLRNFEIKTNQKLVSCHGLRHTYCSMLLSNGVPIQTVSKYMGHSDSSITLKVYTHFMTETQDIAISVLDKIVKGSNE